MGLLPGEKEAIFLSAEGLAESGSADPMSRWIGGIVFPVAPTAAGVVFAIRAAAIWLQHAVIDAPVQRAIFVQAGISIFLFAIAAFAHAHFFWTPHPKWHFLGWLGKTLSASVIVVLLLLAVYQGFVNS